MTRCRCKRTPCVSLHTSSGDITFGPARECDRRATLETETSLAARAHDHEVRALANGGARTSVPPTPPTCLGPKDSHLRHTAPACALRSSHQNKAGLIGDAFTVFVFISRKGALHSVDARPYISATQWTTCCVLCQLPRTKKNEKKKKKRAFEACATEFPCQRSERAHVFSSSPRTRLPPAVISGTDVRTHDH